MLTVILVGLPELAEQRGLRRNRSLDSRITRRLRIAALEPEDTADVLRTRWMQAGCGCEFFASDAVVLLHEASGGLLRDLGRLVEASLGHAAHNRPKLIERSIAGLAIGLDFPNAA